MSLTLRGWREEDLEPFARLNADPGVMRHFTSVLTRAESDALAERFVAAHRSQGFGVQVLDVEGFAGIVGLSVPRFGVPPLDSGVVPANPTVEVLWRLVPHAQGRGLATAAATRVLDHAFTVPPGHHLRRHVFARRTNPHR